MNADYVEQCTGGEVKGQTGSLTALPVIETQAGDVSAFVPTNVISITDGQIFLEADMFNAGVRPAMNAGISVSRVGGAAQTKIVKKLSGGIRTALAQYRELAAFSQFASDLDDATKAQLEHGERITELMKQKQYAPLTIAEMGVLLYAGNEGYLQDVEVAHIGDFESALLGDVRAECGDVMQAIEADGGWDDEREATFKSAIETSSRRRPGKQHGSWQGNPHQDLEHTKHSEDHQRDGNGGGEQNATRSRSHGVGQALCPAHARGGWAHSNSTLNTAMPTCSSASKTCWLHYCFHGPRVVRWPEY